MSVTAVVRREVLVVGALLVVAALLRFWDLEADPPPSLSWSQGLHTDGAVVVQNARNQVLWGKPVLDYGIDMYWFPLSYAATLATFSIAGVSTAAARATSIVLSLGAIGCIAGGLLAERGANSWRAPVTILFLAVSFPFAMYNRLPLAEPAMIALLAASFLCFCRGSRDGSNRWIALSGFFSVAAPLFGKAHAAYMPMVGLLALALGGREQRSRRRIVAYLIGCASALVLWTLLLVLPYGREIIDHYLHESVVKHGKSAGQSSFLAEALTNAITMGAAKGVGFLSRELIVVTLAFASLPLLVLGRARSRALEPPSALFAALWLVIGWAFISCVKFPAPRYLSALIPPAAVLAGALLFPGRAGTTPAPARARDSSAAPREVNERETAKRKSQERARASRVRDGDGPRLGAPWLAAIFVASLAGALVFLAHAGALASPFPFLAPLEALVPDARSPGYPGTLVVPGAAIAAGVTFLLWRARAGIGAPPRALAVALVALSVVLQGYQFAGWSASASHTVVSAGRAVGEILGESAHLLGAYAPALTLDNRLRSSPYFGPEYMGPDHEPELFTKYGITHIIFGAQGDIQTLRDRYPDVFRAMRPVAEFPFRSLWSDRFILCRVPSEIDGKRMNDYAPTEREVAAEAAQAAKTAQAGQATQPEARP